MTKKEIFVKKKLEHGKVNSTNKAQ